MHVYGICHIFHSVHSLCHDICFSIPRRFVAKTDNQGAGELDNHYIIGNLQNRFVDQVIDYKSALIVVSSALYTTVG